VTYTRNKDDTKPLFTIENLDLNDPCVDDARKLIDCNTKVSKEICSRDVLDKTKGVLEFVCGKCNTDAPGDIGALNASTKTIVTYHTV